MLYCCPPLGCDVLYLKEPPPTIQCNPYSVEARLVLECQVQIPATVGSRAKVIWLFQDSNQVKHQITDSAIFSPLFDNTQRTTVSGHAWLLYNSITLDGSAMKSQMHRGLYFCQVFLDGKNVTTLSPSSGLLVEDEDNGPTYYLNQHPCLGEIQVQNVMRCAGNISLVTTLKPVLNFTTRLPSTDFPYHSSTVSSISVLGAGATLTTTDQREAPIGLWIYAMAGIAVTMAFCGITVMLGIFWLGHKLRGVRTIDTFKCKLNKKVRGT